ncbi:caspase family protein [uncultured Psychroserpens sp.]|uniref:caspase family protein n=1 Tax=uncultured Psychroserpens sp. TaxID=255436 RepID=UPI00262E3AAE|nr:caspase family protein [uncultured Psychroserpens sp.]
MKRYAIISCVLTNTVSSIYKNSATVGVELVAKKLYNEIKPKFGNNVSFIKPNATKEHILSEIRMVSNKLDSNGMLFFYFHGHGDTIDGRLYNDEKKDQVLVCTRNYLVDDTLDLYIRKFKPTQRILSIVDSCSSETVVEWSQYKWKSYPQIIHISSSRDGDVAYAYTNGGILSNKLAHLLYGGQYNNWTYEIMITRLKTLIPNRCYINKTPNVKNNFLKDKIFN